MPVNPGAHYETDNALSKNLSDACVLCMIHLLCQSP
jgi:hypothetical protein